MARYYVIGEDFCDYQADIFDANPTDELHPFFSEEGRSLDSAASGLIRTRFKDGVLSGLNLLLRKFAPLKGYSESLRTIENQYCDKSDLAQHAFYQLRFGSNLGPTGKDEQDSIRTLVGTIETEVIRVSDGLPLYLKERIGMRAVMYAFGMSWEKLRDEDHTITWKECAEWAVPHLNRLYEEGWFHKKCPQLGKHSGLLHLVHDHSDTKVNYRHGDTEQGFGAMIWLLMVRSAEKKKDRLSKEQCQEITEDLLDTIETSFLRGFKKQVRPELKEKYPDGGKPLNDAVAKEASRMAAARKRQLEKYLADY